MVRRNPASQSRFWVRDFEKWGNDVVLGRECMSAKQKRRCRGGKRLFYGVDLPDHSYTAAFFGSFHDGGYLGGGGDQDVSFYGVLQGICGTGEIDLALAV